MKTKKLLSGFLSLSMLFAHAANPVLAEETTTTVYLTVSNQGVISKTSDNLPAALLPVQVTDLDGDDKLTFHDALLNAHITYNSEDGYSAPSGYVSKLWGVETSNTLFFSNNKGLTTGVSADIVDDGDYLVASLNKDNTYWADWYTYFDTSEKTLDVGEEFSITLKGHLGMGYLPEDLEDTPLTDISIGILKDGNFEAIDNLKTDENGQVTLVFDEAGTYYISADGTVSDAVTDYSLSKLNVDSDLTGGADIYGSIDYTTFKPTVAYTESDYGNGPYPAGEVKYIPLAEWKESPDTYFALHSNKILADCPIIAPACKISVTEPLEETILKNIADRYRESGILTDENMLWLAADFATYEMLYPDREKILSDNQKQAIINKIAENAETAKSASDLSKLIIAMRALGYDAKSLYTKDGEKIDLVAKLSGLVDAKDAGVTNIYTLPYVLTALMQGDEYATAEQLDFLKNTAVLSKSLWQDTEWGIDGATPMIIALSPYYAENEDIKTAIDEAIELFKPEQSETGAILSFGADSAASTGLAIAALCSVGQNPEEFKNEENSLVSGLLGQASENLDGFLPIENSFSTEQALRGLLAYMIYKNESEFSLFDFKDNPMNEAFASWSENCSVAFDVTPKDANVLVDNQTPENNGKYDLPAGEYSYTVSKSGYKTKTGTFTVTEEEAENKTEKNISVELEKKGSSGIGGDRVEHIRVSVKILGHDDRKCDNKYTYKKDSKKFETILNKKVTLNEGETVFDAFLAAVTEAEIEYTEKSYGYITSINGLKEFDHGPNSGWMFSLDGELTDTGCRDTKLSENCTVVWFYTDDYGKEDGSTVSSSSSSSSSSKGNGSSIAPAIIQNTTKPETPKTEETKQEDDTTPTFTFTDVSEDSWYYDAVNFANTKKLMKGTEKGFEPELPLSRAMLVTILYRLDGAVVSATPSFSDVGEGSWYEDSVFWAKENNIVNGISETEFAPDAPITREQFATILYRYIQFKGYELKEKGNLSEFEDSEDISDWAYDALSHINAGNLISGVSKTKMSPKGTATRAQAATILMRFHKKFIK